MTSARSFAALALLGLSGTIACRSEGGSAETKEIPKVAASAPTAAEAKADDASATAASPRFDEKEFALEIEAPAQVKVGAPFQVSVRLTAKDGYKVNPEYPIKFAFDASPELAIATPVLRKEQGAVEKTKATLSGGVTAQSAAVKVVRGRMSFSVCTEERCLIEKRDLIATISAS